MTMQTTSGAGETAYEETTCEEAAPDSQFESYYDKDSGHWSLRRIPSTPPAEGADATEI